MGTEKHALCVGLATLIYVDWLPTGQWSAVSSIVYSRGSQISLCRHSYFVDSSNLEMAEALSGCLQLLPIYQAMLSVIMPHMKHASSLAIAVLATLCFLHLLSTIL